MFPQSGYPPVRFSAPPFATDTGIGRPGSRVGLVLSGGGVRGAYEVGVVRGIVDALELEDHDAAPFGIFAGTSVGAINATYLTAHADRGRLSVDGLADLYRNLAVEDHLKVNWGALARGRASSCGGASLLDPRPLERLVAGSIDWNRMHDVVTAGNVRALIVAALDLSSAETTLFAEVAPGTRFRHSLGQRRSVSVGQISPEHVLASAAIPLVFPARRIGGSYYCDGGVRFNTPIAPAIRAGATRLVVVTLGSGKQRRPSPERSPGFAFVLGRMFDALLADPVAHDLHVAERLNRLLEVAENHGDPQMLTSMQETLIDTRGAPYRQLKVLEFSPTADLAQMAARHVQALLRRRGPRALRWLSRLIERSETVRDGNWATYLLFDGGFAGELFELGRRDANARREEIREFFRSEDGASIVAAQ